MGDESLFKPGLNGFPTAVCSAFVDEDAVFGEWGYEGIAGLLVDGTEGNLN